jgi:hypothetical protein
VTSSNMNKDSSIASTSYHIGRRDVQRCALPEG